MINVVTASALLALVSAPTVTYPLVVMGVPNKGASWNVFTMSPGACLKGPLSFYKQDGTEIFALKKGADFPAGCAKRP